jgi:hypothetical protein
LIETPAYPSASLFIPYVCLFCFVLRLNARKNRGTLGILSPEDINRIGLYSQIRTLFQHSTLYSPPWLVACLDSEVEADTAGLDPDSLEATLASWSEKHPGKRFPKLLYTIPTGSNPTGASAPEDRKRQM